VFTIQQRAFARRIERWIYEDGQRKIIVLRRRSSFHDNMNRIRGITFENEQRDDQFLVCSSSW
jgi:hypothetical protein